MDNKKNLYDDVIEGVFTEVEESETEQVQDDYSEYVEDITSEDRKRMRRMTQTRDIEVDDSGLTEKEISQVKKIVEILDYRNFDTVDELGRKEMMDSMEVSRRLETQDKLKNSELGRTLGDLEQFIVHNKVTNYGNKKDIKESWVRNPVSKTLALFNNKKNEVVTLNAGVGASLDKIENKLKDDKHNLVRANDTLEDLYENNKQMHRNIRVLVEAITIKIKDMEQIVVELEEKYKANEKDTELYYEFRDAQDFLTRLREKAMTFQGLEGYTQLRAPQIRAMQNNNAALITKLDDAVILTIPIWRGLFTTAINAQQTENTLKISQSVREQTNMLLESTAELVASTTKNVAHERQKGIFDIEALDKSTNILLEGIKEAKVIEQNTIRENETRLNELKRVQNNMKNGLLEISETSSTVITPSK